MGNARGDNGDRQGPCGHNRRMHPFGRTQRQRAGQKPDHFAGYIHDEHACGHGQGGYTFSELAALLEQEGKAFACFIRAQREDIFDAMHRI